MSEHYSRDTLLQLSAADIVKFAEKSGEKLTRSEMVPINQISLDGMVVDKNHATDLGHAMLGPWGQTQSVLLAARLEGDSLVYHILDGYHRIAGWKRISEDPNPVIKSQVMYGCTDEDVIDQRVLAANSVKQVRFARIGIWMKAAWSQTPWSDKLTITQAFGLAITDSSGERLGLDKNEVLEIKKWASQKAEKWLMPLGTLYQNLRIIEVSDPELVRRVRTGTFSPGQLSITPAQLEVIAFAFPNDYVIQNRIARFANGHSLSKDQIMTLVDELKENGTTNIKEIEEVFSIGSWKRFLDKQTSEPSQTESGPSERLLSSLNPDDGFKAFSGERPALLKTAPSFSSKRFLASLSDFRTLAKYSVLTPGTKIILSGQLDAIHEEVETDMTRIPKVEKFFNEWVGDSDQRYKDLATKKPLARDFANQITELSVRERYALLKALGTTIFESVGNKSEAAITIIPFIPIDDLESLHIENFLRILTVNISSLLGDNNAPGKTSSILESISGMLERMHSLKNIAPEEWSILIKAISEIRGIDILGLSEMVGSN